MNHKKWFLILLAWAVLLTAACSRNSDRIDGPKPSLSGVQPDLLCVEEADQQVTLSGDGMAPLMIDTATDDAKVVLPKIFLQQTKDLAGAVVSGAETPLSEEDVTWESQQSMTVMLRMSLGLEPGVYRVRIENGSGAEFVLEDALTIVPSPVVQSVNPELVCLDQGEVDITITGTGFIDNDGVLPTVNIGDQELSATSLDNCLELEAPSGTVRRCTDLVVTVPEASLDGGAHAVTVTNPAPADCTSTEDVSLFVIPSPVIDSVATTTPCDQNADDFTIIGSNFLQIGAQQPSVTIAGVEAQVMSMDDCVPITYYPSASLCTSMRVTVPAGTVALGNYEVILQNPGESTCRRSCRACRPCNSARPGGPLP